MNEDFGRTGIAAEGSRRRSLDLFLDLLPGPRLLLLALAVLVVAIGAAAVASPTGGRPADGAGAAGTVVVTLGPGARVDWTRGLLVATGAAAGDLRAPSPELARVKAERQARDVARARLRRLARSLPLADGRELGAAIEGPAEKRLERALDAVLDEQVEHASDGSVVLAAALPLEAARAAVFGASPPAAPGYERGPTAVLVEAGRHLKHPVLGLKLAAGKERYAGPTIFATRTEVLGPDRLGGRPVKVRAAGFRGGALQLEGFATRLAEARAAGSLVVVELAPQSKGRGDKRATREADRTSSGSADKERRR